MERGAAAMAGPAGRPPAAAVADRADADAAGMALKAPTRANCETHTHRCKLSAYRVSGGFQFKSNQETTPTVANW